MSHRSKGAAIGIDLGTTYSCAGVWFHKKNRVEIIPNEQGNKITPSFIGRRRCKKPDCKESDKHNVKRLIGSRFTDPQVQKDMKSWPFKVIEGPSDNPIVVVEFNGEEKKYAPDEVSAMVLKKMKEACLSAES
ncbi:hypothetical protein Lser_V15G39553 [Lactuca serriola]